MPSFNGIAAPSDVRDRRIGYLLLRLTVGVSLLGHGLVRLPKLGEFHDALLQQFTQSFIPAALVSVGGYVLPVAEFVFGAAITLGILTRLSLIGAALEIITLVFGSTTIENWSAIGDQLLHAIPLAALLAFAGFNAYSVDHVLLRRRATDRRTTGG